MSSEDLLVTDDGPVRTIAINRVERRNALTPDVSAQLAAAVTTAADDPVLRVVAVRGMGGHFSAGLDLRWMAQQGRALTPVQLQEGLSQFQSSVRAVMESGLPVVALCEGTVAGFGLDLALACDLRLAAPSARFTSAFAARGLVPDGGSTWTLPRLVGRSRAFRFLVDGSTLDADAALAAGMVDAVVPEEELGQAAAGFAEAIAGSSRRSIGVIKTLLTRHADAGWDDALGAEGRAQLEALGSEDFRDRLAAFLSRST